MTENEHEVTITPTDEGYQLECPCSWSEWTPQSPPTKDQPDRSIDGFAQALKERHYITNNWWPYTTHGKPEIYDSANDEIKIISDWPYNKS